MFDLSYDARCDVVLIADAPAAVRDLAEAVTLAGGRVAARLGWHDMGALRDAIAVDVLAIDTGGVADATLDAALPEIARFADERGTRVVVALSVAQIDLVSAHLFGRQVQLLCAAGPADLVAALSIAGAMRLDCQVNEARDAEAARLRRLNEEVARIAETLARLTRGDTPPPDRGPASFGDRTLGYGAPPAEGDEPAAVTAHDLRQAIRARRLRSQFFDDGLFEDPAWDMLLDLYAAEMERAQVSVSSLCIAAAVAPTTALRWIAKMTEAELLERHPDPFDRRRAFMALSDKARGGMRSYCAAARRAGLSIA